MLHAHKLSNCVQFRNVQPLAISMNSSHGTCTRMQCNTDAKYIPLTHSQHLCTVQLEFLFLNMSAIWQYSPKMAAPNMLPAHSKSVQVEEACQSHEVSPGWTAETDHPPVGKQHREDSQLPTIQPGAVKLVLWRHQMHLSFMHPMESETSFTAPGCISIPQMSLLSADHVFDDIID